jgi:hypothetical protein
MCDDESAHLVVAMIVGLLLARIGKAVCNALLACLRALAVAHVNVASGCGSYVVFGSCLLLLAQFFVRHCARAQWLHEMCIISVETMHRPGTHLFMQAAYFTLKHRPHQPTSPTYIKTSPKN